MDKKQSWIERSETFRVNLVLGALWTMVVGIGAFGAGYTRAAEVVESNMQNKLESIEQAYVDKLKQWRGSEPARWGLEDFHASLEDLKPQLLPQQYVSGSKPISLDSMINEQINRAEWKWDRRQNYKNETPSK